MSDTRVGATGSEPFTGKSLSVSITLNTIFTRSNMDELTTVTGPFQVGEVIHPSMDWRQWRAFYEAWWSDYIADHLDDRIVSMCASLECGEDDGRFHVQMALKLKSQMKYVGIKDFLAATGIWNKAWCKAPWIERCKNWNALTKYCTKEDETTVSLLGAHNIKVQQPGKRNDIHDGHEVLKRLKTGELTEEETWAEDAGFAIMMKYPAGCKAYLMAGKREKQRSTPTRGLWLWGATGSGKTMFAKRFLTETIGLKEDELYWWNLNDNEWAEGYDNGKHKAIIMDELRASCGKHCSIGSLCRLVDWTPTSLKQRGQAPMPVTASWVVVTSPENPDLTYAARTHQGDSVAQLERRFIVREMEELEPTEAIEL